jgi:hypothetical protein
MRVDTGLLLMLRRIDTSTYWYFYSDGRGPFWRQGLRRWRLGLLRKLLCAQPSSCYKRVYGEHGLRARCQCERVFPGDATFYVFWMHTRGSVRWYHYSSEFACRLLLPPLGKWKWKPYE